MKLKRYIPKGFEILLLPTVGYSREGKEKAFFFGWLIWVWILWIKKHNKEVHHENTKV